MTTPEKPSTVSIGCPCCGDDAWIGQPGDEIFDGQALLCGCGGHISCDSETTPYVNVDSCDCQDEEER
jgi:hypothetical protein